MIEKILILGFCCILCGASAANVCEEAGLVTTDGFLPHPTNCSMYISCYKGNAYELSCPAGYYFNPTEKLCDAKYECLVNNCPQTGIARLPVEGVCEQFVLCIGGTAYLRHCGDGLLFNATLEMCVNATESTCVTNQCDKTLGHPQGFEDPHNCMVYYICDENFLPVRFDCPKGTIFDQSILDCVKGECQASSTTTTTTAATQTSTSSSSTITGSTVTGSTVTESTVTGGSTVTGSTATGSTVTDSSTDTTSTTTEIASLSNMFKHFFKSE
ncbi:uncharacterized protein LOC131434870 [Malaya genurostris]|uniref:uncharacterized protein LOC131434870 n=1 Tax=Malaya genurostris TaxID=325434 RepID=UPI0026F3D889|nr:uncharacterized protein LOC131434870 [Malaya genurostris]